MKPLPVRKQEVLRLQGCCNYCKLLRMMTMPQTKERYCHAQAAGVPMIIAINKVNKPILIC